MSEGREDGRSGREKRPDLRVLPVTESDGPRKGPGGRQIALSDAERSRAVELLAEGKLTRTEIARSVGCSVSMITKIAKEVGAATVRASRPPATFTLTETAADRSRAAREAQRELAVKLARDALEEAGLRADLGTDIKARKDLSASLQMLIRAMMDLEEMEQRIRESERSARAESDLDEWLDVMSGAAG